MNIFEALRLMWYLIEFSWDSIYYRFWGAEIRDEDEVKGKVVILTSANTGIGKAIAIKMAKRGATVILGCQNELEGKEAQEDIQYESGSRKTVLLTLDLADFKSIRNFATEVVTRYPEIHILVNNAEICADSKELKNTTYGYELHMSINYLGHFLLTNLLLNNIKRAAPSRIIVLSSTSLIFSELDDLNDILLVNNKQSKSMKHFYPLKTLAYNNSKLANGLFAKELGRRLQGSGVNVYSVCPGLSNANIFKEFSGLGKIIQKISYKLVGLSLQKAADSVLYCALSKKCDHETGKFYRFEKICPTGQRKLKADAAKQLWIISENALNFYMGDIKVT